ncbi:thioesterase domain-containing protein [Xenorhabdus sp. Sc-CR9]|uniref:thioesterase domain-containing protein n=1 Tax=Xenorhabdus sp. Sc-CR9 TaxID=2584468 RepID=UPI001F39214D|nr:alpha/beta fold hydrolase [Xenorhabdus sp. Sc-CR9]
MLPNNNNNPPLKISPTIDNDNSFPLNALGEIESCLTLCPDMREAMVLIRTDEEDQKCLIAYQLLTRMQEQNMETPLATLLTYSTLIEPALAMGERTSSPSDIFDANPVPLSPKGNLLPLFFVHESSGDPLVYSPLATLLPPELPVYALQALGLHTLSNPPTSIEALASCHIQAIRRVQPHGPYHLAGWSMGGVIAYEIAQQLINSKEDVAFIGMIDAVNPAQQKTALDDTMDKTQKRIHIMAEFLHKLMAPTDALESEELRHLEDIEQFFELCIERKWLPAGITREDFFLRVYTTELLMQLKTAYVPSASPLPIHLYTTDSTVNGDKWRGWKGIVSNTSVIHPIRGTHYTIMQFPLRNQIADSITGILLPALTYDPLVIIQGDKNDTQIYSPLFCLPGAGASASSFLELALSFPSSLPVYALQARGLTTPELPPYTSIEGAANDYIKKIRQTQPTGPYHLLGHSFGGWIAFEIALQLQAQGEQVANLILLDTNAPTPQNYHFRSYNRIETLMKLIKLYNMMINQPLPLTKQDLEGLTHNEQILCLHQALVHARLFTANSPVSLLEGVVQVMQANLNTCYTPRAQYDGCVHFINAKEKNIDEIQDSVSQWENYASQLDTMLASGNHMTMLSMPHVRQLAPELWQNLNGMED